ncbi:MAG: NADH-ubiquinone oxidoreductase-F iron-sulfur binding region domain-containing protein [Patescibacteria group bacterium]|jgi:NADH:ubiquinone oxidoreductase subunit F (NADH-binding)
MINSRSIIKKIEAAGLVGRGGASYSTAQKWAVVKAALKNKKSGYIILNGAEGEPGVKKDGYIINHYPAEVIAGLYLADQFLGTAKIKKVYIFLNQEYYKKYSAGLKVILERPKYKFLEAKTEFFVKPERLAYISGEESALLNLIEGKKVEPRLKPPFPAESGLYDQPTLINNTETFYNLSLAVKNKYRDTRFYTIDGAVKHSGVYNLAANLTIEAVLRQTNNWPTSLFFVQAGGAASGEVLNSHQLERPVEGAGSIRVYDLSSTVGKKLFQSWIKFYQEQSCGKCTACREGTYRLAELVSSPTYDDGLFWEIVDNLADSSFCALGSSLPEALRSYVNNLKK